MLEIELGRPVDPGKKALHTCDNPPCCNGRHLYEGTSKRNSADMVARGRSAAGDRNASRVDPSRLPRGDGHWSRRDPDKAAAGGAKRSGDAHWTRRTPERVLASKHTRVTEEEVRLILAAVARGVLQVTIAEALKLTPSIVNDVARGRTMRHVTPEAAPAGNANLPG